MLPPDLELCTNAVGSASICQTNHEVPIDISAVEISAWRISAPQTIACLQMIVQHAMYENILDADSVSFYPYQMSRKRAGLPQPNCCTLQRRSTSCRTHGM